MKNKFFKFFTLLSLFFLVSCSTEKTVPVISPGQEISSGITFEEMSILDGSTIKAVIFFSVQEECLLSDFFDLTSIELNTDTEGKGYGTGFASPLVFGEDFRFSINGTDISDSSKYQLASSVQYTLEITILVDELDEEIDLANITQGFISATINQIDIVLTADFAE
jgi:hypothetical protein